MVHSLDDSDDLKFATAPGAETVDGGSRSLVKRRGSSRSTMSERLKYRNSLNICRLKKTSRYLSQHEHFNNLTKDINQALNTLNPDHYEDINKDVKEVSGALTDETDVPIDQNDIEMNYDIIDNNAVKPSVYPSCAVDTVSTVQNISGLNISNIQSLNDLADKKNEDAVNKNIMSEVNNEVKSDLINAVNQTSPVSSAGGGTRLVKKDITRLGKLELIENIENYVQVNFSNYRQFYDKVGPIRLNGPLAEGLKSNHVDISLWDDPSTQLISQNSSKRKVYNIYWIPKIFSNISLRAAIKFVEDSNVRDGRSIKREIECHLYMYQRFQAIFKSNNASSLILQDDWPTVEVLGYYLDKKDPGKSVLISRKLTGPDFFYIIRSENNSSFVKRITPIYEFNKLDWCITALNRISQFGSVGIRHNDIKPDNIVLDVYFDQGVKKVDVKIIDLGAASMEYTKEFTGGTPWYESPEQKLLEYYTKKNRNSEMARKVNIDISSDAWGAGLSIVEVLMGRRVVDYIKQPYGIGLLNFTGIPQYEQSSVSSPNLEDYLWWNREEYWEINPEVWVHEAKKVLGLTCEHCAMVDSETMSYKGNYSDDMEYTDKVEYTNYSEAMENNYMDGSSYMDNVDNKEFEDFYTCSVCNYRYNETIKENICKIVARYVFNSLIVVDPRKRKNVQEVANQLRSFVTQAISYYL
ncbi:hypothetical protein MACK_001396 [Theileria orientalis]|uniref:Protein kinase domain-containing protein n=1 Tax=Theileria orientalis TaxID=68886 RepID=A0A976QX84_THEOR|nr:hypothetical protein MACK_001396 [Theileria orientalis]